MYQVWHSFIPDEIQVGNGDGDYNSVSLHKLMWDLGFYQRHSIQDIVRSFRTTALGRDGKSMLAMNIMHIQLRPNHSKRSHDPTGPNNFPLFLKGITMKVLLDERAQRMQSYNAYREALYLDPIQSFDEFGTKDDDLTSRFAELYGIDVENVEFCTGIIADR